MIDPRTDPRTWLYQRRESGPVTASDFVAYVPHGESSVVARRSFGFPDVVLSEVKTDTGVAVFPLRVAVLVAAWFAFGSRRFTIEQLAVAAWQTWPKTFGLRGFEQSHPDATKTYQRVYGTDGAVACGFMLMTLSGDRVLSLTRPGKEAAALALRKLLPVVTE